MKEEKITYIEWNDLNEILLTLSNTISKKPDLLIAIQRGGLIPAVILSHIIKVREIITIACFRTENDDINSSKIEPTFLVNNLLNTIRNKNILLIDDIVGSGETIKKCVDLISIKHPKNIQVLTCFLNLDNWEKCNNSQPEEIINYIGKQVRGWIIFPWEKK